MENTENTELENFLKSYDFMRIGQSVSHGQWPSAMMALRRMEQQMRVLGLDSMLRQAAQLRAAIAERNEVRAKNALALLIQKRVQMLNSLQKQ